MYCFFLRKFTWNFCLLFIPCIFLQLIRQPTNALNETEFMTGIDFLHVSAPECHPQGIFQITGIQAQHADLGLR